LKGADGEKGDKGDTGDKGNKGDKGDKGDTGATGPKGKDGEDGVSDTWYNWLFNVGNTLAYVAEGVGIYVIQGQIVTLQGEMAAGFAAVETEIAALQAQLTTSNTLENLESLEDISSHVSDLPSSPMPEVDLPTDLADTGTTGSSTPSTSVLDSMFNSIKNVFKDIAQWFSKGTTTFQGLNNTPLLEISEEVGEFSDYAFNL
jgi:hypothetical protein